MKRREKAEQDEKSVHEVLFFSKVGKNAKRQRIISNYSEGFI